MLLILDGVAGHCPPKTVYSVCRRFEEGGENRSSTVTSFHKFCVCTVSTYVPYLPLSSYVSETCTTNIISYVGRSKQCWLKREKKNNQQKETT